MKSNKISTFRKFIPLFKDHKRSVAIAISLVIISTVLMSLLPLVFRELLDKAIPSKSQDLILRYGLTYLIVLMIMISTQYFEQIIVAYMGIDIVNGLKKKILSHVLKLSVSFFDKTGSGKLISRIESDSQQLFMLFSSVGLQIMGSFLLIFISIVIMFFTSVKLTLIVLCLVPIYVAGTTIIFTKMRPMYKKDRKIYSKISGLIGEHVKAIPLLRSLGSLDWSRDKLTKVNLERRDFSFGLHLRETLVWYVLLIVPSLITAGILYQSISWIKGNIITIGTVVMFVQYLELSIRPLIMVTEQIGEVQKALGAGDRIFEILETKVDNVDTAPKELESFKSKIEFKNVSFHYNEDEPVLKNISFSVKKGETVAIVGATGSGKTTIISLLTRFYEVISGNILIDDIDIKDITKTNLRTFLSVVLQDTFLFPGSVEDNLRVFRDDIRKEKIDAAVKYTGASNFIDKMRGKMKANLAEDGRNLSFGERQLLSFSRALVFEPEILIMDEATSSVDPYTEKMIQEALQKISKGRTSIIIAHRLSTIQNADKIIVLEKGEIVEEGTHDELYKLSGLYNKLYTTQFFGDLN